MTKKQTVAIIVLTLWVTLLVIAGLSSCAREDLYDRASTPELSVVYEGGGMSGDLVKVTDGSVSCYMVRDAVGHISEPSCVFTRY